MMQATPNLVLCELTDTGLEGVESYSPFCLKVHRALRLAGLPYERRCARNPGEFRNWNPTGQVPVLLVDGEPVVDSTLILRRIDEMTGALTRGLDPSQRAEAWLWEELADTALSGFLVSARWADETNWPLVRDALFGKDAPWFLKRLIVPMLRRRVVAGLVARDFWRRGADACWSRFGDLLDELDARAPATGFWLGEEICVADLGLFAQLHGLRTPLTAAQAKQLAERTQLAAYLDRVHAATRSATAAPSSSRPSAALTGITMARAG